MTDNTQIPSHLATHWLFSWYSLSFSQDKRSLLLPYLACIIRRLFLVTLAQPRAVSGVLLVYLKDVWPPFLLRQA